MVWFLFALIAAFFDAVYYSLIKKYTKSMDISMLAAGGFLVSFAVLMTISLIRGIPLLGSAFIPVLLADTFLNGLAVILYFRALKITDLSLVVPMLSFTPVFTLLVSWILLREFPSVVGILGILLIVGGAYVLNLKKDGSGNFSQDSILSPFREMLSNKGIIYGILVALIFSFTITLEKIVVLNSDPLFGTAVIHLLLGIWFGVMMFKNRRAGVQSEFHFFPGAIIGITLALISIAINIALTMQIVPYVVSLKRVSILFSVLTGALFFREKDILQRGIAAVIMVVGVLLIILG